MKVLLDQGLPRTAAALLRQLGYDAVHTAECGLATAKDSEIIKIALQEERVIITLDSDFQMIIALLEIPSPSVVRVRQEGLRAEAAAKLIDSALNVCEPELKAGAFVSLSHDSIRIRRLPISTER